MSYLGQTYPAATVSTTDAGLDLMESQNAAEQRALLELGTAATKDITQSTIDNTPNRLLKVGDDVSLISGIGRKNYIINGNFDIWQRGDSQTTSGYGSDDRWENKNVGSTKTNSKQSFTLGQTDVPGEPEFFSRTVVSSVAGTSNYVVKQQRIEGVRTLAGQTATLSFWAKADAPKNMSVEFVQSFGTGGTPSSGVDGIGVTTCALTTLWQKFTVTVDIPSIAGKILGTNYNDCLIAVFWFDAGTDLDARTNSLGQQSGTFDIAQVQLEKGSQATDFEYRNIGEELALCQRYYEVVNMVGGRIVHLNPDQFNRGYSENLIYNTKKRSVPTGSFSATSIQVMNSGGTIYQTTGLTFNAFILTEATFSFSIVGLTETTSVFTPYDATFTFTFDAEL